MTDFDSTIRGESRRHGERAIGDLRLAGGVEPGQLVGGPQVDAAERQRGAESELRALRRALDREQERGIVAFGVRRRVAERRGVEVGHAATGHDTRRICAPSSESFSSIRS